jgi:hypothetical protein
MTSKFDDVPPRTPSIVMFFLGNAKNVAISKGISSVRSIAGDKRKRGINGKDKKFKKGK